MNMNRLSTLAVCFVMSLAVIAGSVEAKEKDHKKDQKHEKKYEKKHKKKSKSHPNGRGWRAVEHDFKIVKKKLNKIDGKVDEINEKVDAIDEKVDYIAEDVYVLRSALQVQVRVETIKEDVTIDAKSKQVVMFVQVIQNGKGVTDLTADSFRYVNSFPEGAIAEYCENPSCFSEGKAGQYAISLGGAWKSGVVFAGTLGVQSEYDDMISNGTSQVVFDIPEASLTP